MVQFTSLAGPTAGTSWVVRRLPACLGRSPQCQVQIATEGVWDQHARVSLTNRSHIVLTVLGQALAYVNGQPVQQTVLRNGDIVELGAAKLLFSLSPTRPRSLVWREVLTWLGLAAMVVGQAALIYWLAG